MTTCFVDAVEYSEPERATVTVPLRWPLDMSCCQYNAPEGKAAQLQAAAIDLMYVQTGSRFSLCVDTFQPCPACDVCGGWCSCAVRQLDLMQLTWGPIHSIVSIKRHDGVTETVVPTTDYTLVDHRWLRPYRGGLLDPVWPPQDLQVPYGSSLAPTWQLVLRHGVQPPASVLLAAQDLACQLTAFCCNAPCDLPANAVRVTREGVTIELETGMRAIPTVKMALDTYPMKRKLSRLVDPSIPLGLAL